MTYGAHIWTLNITALAWNNWKPRFNLWYHSSWSWTNRQFWAITVFFLYDKHSSVGRRENSVRVACLASAHCLFLALAPAVQNLLGWLCCSGGQEPVSNLGSNWTRAKEYKYWSAQKSYCPGRKPIKATAATLFTLYPTFLAFLFLFILFHFPN